MEWLGEVPGHWDIDRLKRSTISAKNGIWGDEPQQDENDIPCVRVADFDRQALRVELTAPTIRNVIEKERVGRVLSRGDLLLEKSGGGEDQPVGCVGVLFSTTVGAKAMHLRQLFGRFSLSQNCMIIWTTSDRCITRFFYYHFQPLFQWQRSMIPDHMQPSFRMEDLYGYAIALPPQKEQEAIIVFLDTETAKLDTLTAEAQRAIDLLQERRTALISAAVTGQIDVRNAIAADDEVVGKMLSSKNHEIF